MKKLTLFALLIILVSGINAQMTLDQSFNITVGDSSKMKMIYVKVSDPTSKTCNFATKYKKDIKIYNLDYSLYKTLTVTPSTPVNNIPDDHVEVIYMSQKLFNNDDKIEFLVASSSRDTITYKYNVSTVLMDEDGTILQTFNNESVRSMTLTSNNQYKLTMEEYVVYGGFGSLYDYKLNIYSLGGTYTQSLKSTKTGKVETPYPNPAQTTITLPYTIAQGTTASLKIYSINGALIDEKQIDSYFNSILLNVNSYSPGTYIYEYNGISNKFTVN